MARLSAATGDLDQVQSARHVGHRQRNGRRVFVRRRFETFEGRLQIKSIIGRARVSTRRCFVKS